MPRTNHHPLGKRAHIRPIIYFIAILAPKSCLLFTSTSSSSTTPIMAGNTSKLRLQMVLDHLKNGTMSSSSRIGLDVDLHNKIFYDGRIQEGHGPSFSSYNPARGTILMQHQSANSEDVEAAVKSAKKAFPSWSSTSPRDRARILLKAVDLLRENNDLLARIETLDTGKAF